MDEAADADAAGGVAHAGVLRTGGEAVHLLYLALPFRVAAALGDERAFQHDGQRKAQLGAGGIFAQRRARLGKGRFLAALLQGEAADALDDGGKFHFVWLGIVGKERVEVGFQQARQRREQLHVRAGDVLFPFIDGLRRDAKALGHLFLRERKRLAARKDGFSKAHTFPSLTVSRKTRALFYSSYSSKKAARRKWRARCKSGSAAQPTVERAANLRRSVRKAHKARGNAERGQPGNQKPRLRLASGRSLRLRAFKTL